MHAYAGAAQQRCCNCSRRAHLQHGVVALLHVVYVVRHEVPMQLLLSLARCLAHGEG
jgi:hypothetical protein